jgi:hypothetical protein
LARQGGGSKEAACPYDLFSLDNSTLDVENARALANNAGFAGPKLGASAKAPVMEMFWGDRCGTIVAPDGYVRMVATHVSEPTPKEIVETVEKMKSQTPGQS